MRTSILAKLLFLVTLAAAPACLSDFEGAAPLGSTEGHVFAPAQVPGEHDGDQLDANEEAAESDHPCGLSTLSSGDHTDYWIRSCYEHETGWQIVVFDGDTVYDDKIHMVAPLGTVSGSVRGKVIRAKRL